MRQFSRHTWMLVGGCGVVLIILFLLFRSDSTTPAYTSPPLLPRSYGEVFALDGSRLRFFNGRAFVDYSVSDGSTSVMLPRLIYPPVKNIQWNQDGSIVLLTSIFHQTSDNFGRVLRRRGESLSAQRHWIVNIKQGTFVPIPDNIENVSWRGSFIVGSQLHSSEESAPKTGLYTINAQTGTATPLGLVVNLHTVLPTSTKDVYVLRRNSDTYTVTKVSSTEQQDIFHANNDTARISPDGHYLALLDPKQGKDEAEVVPEASVRLIDLTSGKDIKRFTDFSLDSLISFISSDELVVLDPAQPTPILRYSISNKSVHRYELAKEQPPMQLGLVVRAFGDKLLVETPESVQLIGFRPLNAPIPHLTLDAFSLEGDGFKITKKEDGLVTTSFTINIYKQPVEKRVEAALAQLRQSGLNPDIFPINIDTTHLFD